MLCTATENSKDWRLTAFWVSNSNQLEMARVWNGTSQLSIHQRASSQLVLAAMADSQARPTVVGEGLGEAIQNKKIAGWEEWSGLLSSLMLELTWVLKLANCVSHEAAVHWIKSNIRMGDTFDVHDFDHGLIVGRKKEKHRNALLMWKVSEE